MPIRIRIALATAVLMVVSLALLGSGVYFATRQNLMGDLDQRLRRVYSAYQRDPSQLVLVGENDVRQQLSPPDPFASAGSYIQITDEDGRVLSRSGNLGDREIPIAPETLARNLNGATTTYESEIAGKRIRVLSGRLVVEVNDQLATVQVAESLEPLESTLSALRRALLLGSIAATVALTLGAWLIADAALGPLASMSGTARVIGRTRDLSRRLDPPQTRDEVQQLAETFNDMLARLEETFNAQRRFVADASHELRTPLTALRANADIIIRQLETGHFDPADLLEGVSDMRDEGDRMTRLVQNLLTLARADVGWRPEMEPVDVADALRDAVRVAAPLARGQTTTLTLPEDADADAWQLHGNADQLRQLVLILLDNAYTYTPPDTRVRVALSRDGDDAVIEVSDDGPGISDEHLTHVFERFYRADNARARTSGGSGLGLAIARWIVAVHAGSIAATNEPAGGACFTIRLPLARDDATSARERRERTEPAAVG